MHDADLAGCELMSISLLRVRAVWLQADQAKPCSHTSLLPLLIAMGTQEDLLSKCHIGLPSLSD